MLENLFSLWEVALSAHCEWISRAPLQPSGVYRVAGGQRETLVSPAPLLGCRHTQHSADIYYPASVLGRHVANFMFVVILRVPPQPQAVSLIIHMYRYVYKYTRAETPMNCKSYFILH